MALSNRDRDREDRTRELARLVGISIFDGEVSEVTNRFESLMLELDRLRELDLSDIQPVVIFPDEDQPDQDQPNQYQEEGRDHD